MLLNLGALNGEGVFRGSLIVTVAWRGGKDQDSKMCLAGNPEGGVSSIFVVHGRRH